MQEEVERMQLTFSDIFPGSKHTLYQHSKKCKWRKKLAHCPYIFGETLAKEVKFVT